MFKLYTFLTNIFAIEHSSSFLSATFFLTMLKNIISKIWNFILSILWTVCKLVFGVMEAFEYMIHEFLGIGTTVKDLTYTAEQIEVGGVKYLDTFVGVFKNVVIVSMILLIVFTIFAMIKQEWDHAHSGYSEGKDKKGNSKNGILVRLLTNLVSILALPLTMIFLIAGVNAVLTSFNNALNVNSDVTIAGQVLATSTYDSNKYRTYANSNQRVPIIISAYDTSDVKPDEMSALQFEIQSLPVQKKLKATATNLANNTFLSYKDTLTYQNNKFYNSSAYADYYEQFVTTPEQYQIMADFVDYAQMYGLSYYIKSMDEVDIEWKYVNSVVYDKAENALNIVYRDATDFDDDGNKNDTYTMTLAPSNEVTSPISDALNSIMGMLGIGDYGKNQYKVMERDDSGNFLNLVQWANEKALIRFSENFRLDNSNTWTDTDEIIVYEFYHFASNNTFGTNTLDDFKVERNTETGELEGGVELDVSKIVYKDYYPAADAYSKEKTIYCVLINGNYYNVHKSTELTDSYGNSYYELTSLNGGSLVNKNVHFLDPDYSLLTKTDKEVTLQLSSSFDINEPCTFDGNGNIQTMKWTVSDQILVYEYYKDLSVGNDFSKYGFKEFYDGSIKFPVYKISTIEANVNSDNVVTSYKDPVDKYYVYINGTYYSLIESSGVYSLPTGDGTGSPASSYLVDPAKANPTYYNYTLEVVSENGENGFTTVLSNPETFLHTPTGGATPQDVLPTDAKYSRYANFNLQLSSSFDYTDVSTWSYKDYFIFYLYSTYNIASSIDFLKHVGVQGSLVTVNGIYCLKTAQEVNVGGGVRSLYIKLEDARNISELNVLSRLDTVETLQNNIIDSLDENLFITFDESIGDKLLISEIESQKFEYSDDYDYYNVSTWTVSDYLLTYFSSLGILPSIDTIEKLGYESFVYNVIKGYETVTIGGVEQQKPITDKLFRFGKEYSAAASSSTYYLSEYNVLNKIKTADGTKTLKYSSIESWLNKDLMEYVSDYNSINTEDVISTYDDLLNNLYASYDIYIKDYDKLVAQLIEDGWNEELNTIANYSYSNDNFDKTDLSTWNMFDLFIYYITGNSSGKFSSSVMLGPTGSQYIKVGNKALNISSGPFAMTVSDGTSITATDVTIDAVSSSVASAGGGTLLSEYYEDSLKTFVKTNMSNLRRISSLKFYYQSKNAVAISADKKYLNTMGSLTDLDVILACAIEGGIDTANKNFVFDIVSDGVNDYIEIADDVYVRVFYSGMGAGEHLVEYATKSTLTLSGTAQNALFTYTSGNDYDAFKLYSDEEDDDRFDYANYMDSAVYAITGKMEPKTYKVFKATIGVTTRSYIAVEVNRKVQIIEYKSIYDSKSKILVSVDNDKASILLNYLYSNYYSDLYSTTISNIAPTDTTVLKEARYATDFDVKNLTTWTPTAIVFHKLDLIAESEVKGKVLKSSDGSRSYFHVVSTDSNGSINNFYIDITETAALTSSDGAYYEYTELDSSRATMLLNLFLVGSHEGNQSYTTKQQAISAYQTFKTALGEQFSTLGETVKNIDDIKTTVAAGTDTSDPNVELCIDVEDPTTWTWFDLLYYQIKGEIRPVDNTKFMQYVSGTGTKRYTYLEIVDSAGTSHFYTHSQPSVAGEYLTQKFTAGTGTEINLSDANSSILEMIYSKLTGKSTGTETVSYYTFTKLSGAVNGFNYIQSTYNLSYYGVYNLPTGTSSIAFQMLATNGNYTAATPGQSEGVSEDGKVFYYSTPSGSNVYEWSYFDFLVNYASGESTSNYYNSNMFKYNDYKYFVVGEYYINMTAISGSYVTFSEASDTTGKVTTTGKLIDIVGVGTVADALTDKDKVLRTYANIESADKAFITAIDDDGITNATEATVLETLRTRLSFSSTFDANDYKTWTVADFVIYYMFANGFYTSNTQTFDFEIPSYFVDDATGTPYTVRTKYDYSINNFQSYLNNGGAPVYMASLLKNDTFGSVNTYKVISFGKDIESNQDVYVNYDVFMELYGKKLAQIVSIPTTNASLQLGGSAVNDVNTNKFSYAVASEDYIVDFTYDNYYFFNFNGEEFEKFDVKDNKNITDAFKKEVNDGDADVFGVLNLKLSDDFVLTNPNTWTLLDYIVVYEYSVGSQVLNFEDESPNANLFYNMKFSELLTVDNYVSLYSYSGESKVLILNGNYYDLTEYIKQTNPDTIEFIDYFVTKLNNYSSGSVVDYIKEVLNNYENTAKDIPENEGKAEGDKIKYHYKSGTFEVYLKEQLASYTAAATNPANELLKKIVQIAEAYVTTGTDEEGLAFAQNTIMLLNQKASDTEMSESYFAEYVAESFGYYHANLVKLSEYTLDSVIKVNSHSRVVDKLDEFEQPVDEDSDGNVDKETLTISNTVSVGDVGAYNFRVLVEKIPFTINRALHVTGSLDQSADTISYVLTAGSNVRYYRTIYYNTKTAYQISLTALPVYEISKVVKEVSWPQKLMNDMQVLYPDLNWGTLIATDGWLDTLGDFTSAYTNGMFETSGNSSNTTAAGLVLSEFFLSVANNVPSSFAQFQYSSLFDEDVIKSLMLSLLGEESYNNLSQQADVFMQMFNNSFAPILDDIAREQDIAIVDGQVDNFVMSVYKSYLATVLLSSDLGEYLYTIATRIYAQYTIYESLACASGDYASYLAYVNDQPDTAGNIVDAFKFSSFYDLVKYENELSGNSTPMFTFSMLNVYRYFEKLANDSLTETEIRTNFKNATSTEVGYRTLYNKLFKKLDEYYKLEYQAGRRVPDNSPLYCFMLETYWAVYFACPTSNLFGIREVPYYLEIYRAYINGEISRWGLVDDLSIKESAKYMSKYDDYTQAMTIEKISAAVKILGLWTNKTYDNTEDMEAFEAFLSKVNIFDNDEYTSIKNILQASLGLAYSDELNRLFTYKAYPFLKLMNASEAGDTDSWEFLQQLYVDLPLLIDEVYAVINLSFDGNPSNNRTAGGSVKIYDDYIYEDVINKLDSLYMSISNYINSQKIIDMITKASITFTLGQYGQNYVTTGYNFNVENRNYTFNSYLSAQRLAEYVYGGAYLEDFGIEPVYTNSDFTGIISQAKSYDSEQKAMRIKLGMWTELRKFASEIANYTAKLYYTTNLKDLAANVNDGIKLTDYIYSDVQGSVSITEANGKVKKTTLEYEILKYLVFEEDISADTFTRLIFGDTLPGLEAMGNGIDIDTRDRIDFNNIKKLARHINGEVIPGFDETAKLNAIKDYLIYIQSDDYTSGYYNPTGNLDASQRIHQVFVNVINYLITYEDNAETEEEDKVNLDNITFKQLKLILMDKIVDYQENPSETSAENANRYIALFNLISTQFTYRELTFESGGIHIENTYAIGTTIKPTDIIEASSTTTSDTSKHGILVYEKKSNNTYLYAKYDIDDTTQDSVLKLAGLSNRPIEELVNLEYDSLYDRNGYYDEAMGDVFVLCLFDNNIGKYIPIMARGENTKLSDFHNKSLYQQYVKEYGIDLQTSFYNNDERFAETYGSGMDAQDISVPTSYPIIAKGIISSSGLPTGIRISDGEVQFYRTNITASAYVDEEAVAATASVSEVNTVGYTNFVESSSHKNVKGENKKTMFIGSYDLKNYISSDADVYYLQDESMYVLPPSDDFGGINVLDQFSAHYLLNGQSYILLLLGISTMLPLLFNATAAVLRRVLDLMFLTLVGPAVIAMKSIDTSEDGKGVGATAYKNWKNMVEKTLLAAFGFIIGFNIYYILAQTALGLEYVSDTTIANIMHIGGLGFISKNLIESIMKYIYLISAASIVKGAGMMLVGIVTSSKVSNPYAPALGGGGEVMETIKANVQDIKNKAEGLASGQALLGARDALIEGAKSMIPGANFIEARMEKAHQKAAQAEAQAVSAAAQAEGVPKEVADKAAQEMVKEQEEARQAAKKQRLDNANQFMATYMGAQGATFTPARDPIDKFKEGFKKGSVDRESSRQKYDKAKKKKKKQKKNAKKPRHQQAYDVNDEDRFNTQEHQSEPENTEPEPETPDGSPS